MIFNYDGISVNLLVNTRSPLPRIKMVNLIRRILILPLIQKEKLDINIKLSNINEMLSNGINPDEVSWNQISKIAFRTFVPESEESRSKGAGGGDAND